VINPVLDVSKYQPRSVFTEQYGNFDDPKAIGCGAPCRVGDRRDPEQQRRGRGVS
jgi:hypothetical protein